MILTRLEAERIAGALRDATDPQGARLHAAFLIAASQQSDRVELTEAAEVLGCRVNTLREFAPVGDDGHLPIEWVRTTAAARMVTA